MRFLADENFNGPTLKALRKALPDLDIVRAQDTAIYQADDPSVLEWAAQEQRIILTHDVQTMTGFAYAPIKADLPMPGVIEISQELSIGQALDELMILVIAGKPSDFENQVRYVPLK